MKWRWNWFSFQRFHSLPQNFMLDCQCSEMHGLRRGLEMMCVTRHSKMEELEPHLSQDRPLSLSGCMWPGSQGNQCPECWWRCRQKTKFSPTWTQPIVPSISLPKFLEEDYPQSQSFPRIYSESLHILGAKGGDVYPLGSLWYNWGERKKKKKHRMPPENLAGKRGCVPSWIWNVCCSEPRKALAVLEHWESGQAGADVRLTQRKGFTVALIPSLPWGLQPPPPGGACCIQLLKPTWADGDTLFQGCEIMPLAFHRLGQ